MRLEKLKKKIENELRVQKDGHRLLMNRYSQLSQEVGKKAVKDTEEVYEENFKWLNKFLKMIEGVENEYGS